MSRKEKQSMSGFKKISIETKNEVLKRAKEGISVADLSKQYGISTKTIYAWLSAGANGGVSQLEIAKLRRENAELCKLIGMITMENSRLKKKTTH